MQIRERPRQLAPAAGDLLSLQRRQQLVDREGSREVRAFPGTPHWGLTSSSSLHVPFLPGSFESSSVLMSLPGAAQTLPALPVPPRHSLAQAHGLTTPLSPSPIQSVQSSSPSVDPTGKRSLKPSWPPSLPLLPPPALSSRSSFRSPAWSFKMSLVAGHCRAETLPSFRCPFSAIQSPGGGLQLPASFRPGAWPAPHSTHPALRFGNKAGSSHVLSLRLE